MIFIVDPNGACVCGSGIAEALSVYQDDVGDFPFSELTIYEGQEVDVEFVLTPKIKKASK